MKNQTTKEIYTVQFHLYKVPEELISNNRSQNRCYWGTGVRAWWARERG